MQVCDTVCSGKLAGKVEVKVKVEVEACGTCTLGGNSKLFYANYSIGKMNSALKNEMQVCDTVCSGKPVCKVEVEVKVKACGTCTLGGNSKLFYASCSIGSMNSTLKNEISIAVLFAARSQRAGGEANMPCMPQP
jgi:hypothetical protein